MGTRSNIFVKLNDHEYGRIYCHWDGYPTYMGKMLLKHYKTHSKCKSLVKLGDMSSLRKNIRPNKKSPHTFENPQDNACVFYGRDRGEANVGMKIVKAESLNDIQKVKKSDWIEYYYVFDGSEWYVGGAYFDKLSNVMSLKYPDSFSNEEED